MFRPSTVTRSFLGITASTVPVLPRSLPLMTITWSPLRMRAGISGSSRAPGVPRMRAYVREEPLEHLRSEGDDLHEVALAQLAGHRAENAGAARVVRGVDEHGRVLVEGDVGAVLAPVGLLGAHDHGGHHLALLDRALRAGGLDRGGDGVPHARVAPARAAADADDEDLAGAGVVGDTQ